MHESAEKCNGKAEKLEVAWGGLQFGKSGKACARRSDLRYFGFMMPLFAA